MSIGYEFPSARFHSTFELREVHDREREVPASMLLEQLQECFGQVPADMQERLQLASIDTLRGWGKRVLSATTLQEVFGEEA